MNMYIKSLSIILAVVYSMTSPGVYPQEMTSALRPLSAAKSAHKIIDDIDREKSSSSGEVTIKIATWKIYKKLEEVNFRNQEAWYNIIGVVETVKEAVFLKEVFDRRIKKVPESWRPNITSRVKGAVNLAEAKKVKLAANVATVKIAIDESGFTLKEAEKEPTASFFEDMLLKFEIPPEKVFRHFKNDAGDILIITKEGRAYPLYVIDKDKSKKATGILVASDAKSSFFVFRTLDKGLFIYRLQDGEVVLLLGPDMNVIDLKMSKDRNFFAALYKNKLSVSIVNIYRFDSVITGEPLHKITDKGEPDEIIFSKDGSALLLQYYKEKRTRLISTETGEELPAPPAGTMLTPSGEEQKAEQAQVDDEPASGSVISGEIKRDDLKVDGNWLDKLISAATSAPFNENRLRMLLKEKIESEELIKVVDWIRSECEETIIGSASTILLEARAKAYRKVHGKPETDLSAMKVTAAAIEKYKASPVEVDEATIRKLIDMAKKVKPLSRKHFEDIKKLLGLSMKIASKDDLMNELIEILEKLPAEQEEPELTIVDGREPESKVDISAALGMPQTVSSPGDDIEIDDSGSGIFADSALDIDDGSSIHEAVDTEAFLEEARVKIFDETTVGGVIALMKKYLENPAVKKSEELQGKIKSIADERKAELDKIAMLYKLLDKAIAGAAGINVMVSDEDDIKAWLEKAQKVFDKEAGSEQELLKAVGIALDLSKASDKKSLYSLASALIKRKRAFFKNWKEVVLKVEKRALKADTFAKLHTLENELKKKYQRHKECLSILLIIIDDKGRKRISEMQKIIARKKKLDDVAGIVYLEYYKLDKAFLEFNTAMKVLKDKSKKRGYKNWLYAVSDAIDFEHTYNKEHGQFARSGPGVYGYHEKKKSYKRLMPLKEHLENVVNKRGLLLKKLRAYREALKVVYGNYAPQEFMIAEDDNKRFDMFIFNEISEGMDEDVLERYKKVFKGSAIAKYVMDIDKHLQHLCKKLKIKKKQYEPLTSDAVRKLLKVDKFPKVVDFLKVHKIEPAPAVSRNIAVGIKAISEINSAA